MIEAQTRSVLLVDDDPAMLETLAEGLSIHGFRTTEVSDPAKALQLLEQSDHDALVTDLRMPKHDGLAVLDHARRVCPERPIIVITAYSGLDAALEALRRGAYHYLTKPFKTEELALFLRRALDEAALRRESRTVERALRRFSAAVGVDFETVLQRWG